MPNPQRTIEISRGYIVARGEDKPFILKIDHITKVAYLITDNRIEFSTSNGQVFDIPCQFDEFNALIDTIASLN